MSHGPAPHRLARALFVLLVSGCHGAPAGRDEPLILNAASQDGALFLSWNAAPATGRVKLRCRRVGGEEWQATEGNARGYLQFEGLENGTAYECDAQRELEGGRTVSSRPVRETPRARRFNWGPPYYASAQAAQDWITESGTDPRSLYLRGQPAKWGPDAPDGAYTNAQGQLLFLLLRFADETFRPPVAPLPPDDVRTVLKRSLWGAANPFDHPERFAMPLTPLERTLKGNVRGFASVNSFAIAYHPELSSRCTNFVPASPSPGKFAIYIDGHVGPTVRTGAATINGLLERGWQVIAMDMPLVGANRVDGSATLRGHNSFYRWPADDVCPAALFVQPLKAVIDYIERENRSGSHPTIMLIGKSGGGWTSFIYGALDPRIDYVVSIAGGMPISMWFREWPPKLADYEQLEPRIFEAVPYEHIMTAAGSRGAFFVYNEHDPCCFRLRPDEPFIRYLQDASLALNKPIGVFVDRENTTHSFSDAAFAALDTFLAATEPPPP